MAFEIRYSQQPLNHPSHTHVYYELLYVLEGEVAMTIRGREHRVEAGCSRPRMGMATSPSST